MKRLRDRVTAWLGDGLNAPLLLGAFALAAYSLLAGSSYSLRLMSVAGVYALLTLGYQFIFGQAGALSLAQGTFFGCGAYVTGILGSQLGWGFSATFPLSLLAPVLLAGLVAAPVLRLESHYFALATLGIGQVMLLIAVHWQVVTGGANGLAGIPGIVLFGATLPRGLPLLATIWGIVAFAALFARLLTCGAWGLAFTVVREDPLAAAASGIDAAALRFAAFLLSALYAGAAGALYVHTILVVSPEVLEFPVMVAVLTMAVIGGRARIAGAILGAVLLVHLPEWLRFVGGTYLVAYGGALLFFIVLAPDGLVGAAELLLARLRPARPGVPPAAIALPPRVACAPVLAIDDLAKSFGGIAAVAGVSLSIAPGEIVGLIGPNGSGKTTLVNLVTGLYRPDRGAVRLGERALAGLPPAAIARAGIGRTFQNGNSLEAMSALDSVATARLAVGAALAFRRVLRPVASRRTLALARGEAMHCLELLGVAAVAMQRCRALPYGTRRRVEIARALALQPAVLLLDEPAAGLDGAEQDDLARRLGELAQGGIAILVIEHNMDFLMGLAQRIVCLDRGRVLAVGTPAAIRRDPDVLTAYLGAAPGQPA
ncbi:MAG: transporter ATP-binding protein [Rhodospirillales bacterium]|nr:transporter ATP-binding protein [Rhodospirillales bacterium]